MKLNDSLFTSNKLDQIAEIESRKLSDEKDKLLLQGGKLRKEIVLSMCEYVLIPDQLLQE